MLGETVKKGFFLYHHHSFIYIPYYSFFTFNSFTFIILIYTIKTFSLLLNIEQCEKFIHKRLTKSTKKAAKYYDIYQLNIYKESRLYLKKTVYSQRIQIK